MNDQSYKSPMAALLWSTTLYGFGQLYNRSHDINRELRANNVPEPTRKTKGLGELYGLASGMTLGLAWSSFFMNLFIVALDLQYWALSLAGWLKIGVQRMLFRRKGTKNEI
ncbi:hypothetical protein ACFSMW_09770 [Virgibacillus halophilus]|uniref:hypothetical protein n=1 Tax=Tigheibacillus halophilus TaxID=361280 RepID=UPI00362945AC